jgi:hypothetical protein
VVQEAGGRGRRGGTSLAKRAEAERDLARQERQMAAADLHEAFLYGGPLEADRRESAELHLAMAREHEQIAEQIERDIVS